MDYVFLMYWRFSSWFGYCGFNVGFIVFYRNVWVVEFDECYVVCGCRLMVLIGGN